MASRDCGVGTPYPSPTNPSSISTFASASARGSERPSRPNQIGEARQDPPNAGRESRRRLVGADAEDPRPDARQRAAGDEPGLCPPGRGRMDDDVGWRDLLEELGHGVRKRGGAERRRGAERDHVGAAAGLALRSRPRLPSRARAPPASARTESRRRAASRAARSRSGGRARRHWRRARIAGPAWPRPPPSRARDSTARRRR